MGIGVEGVGIVKFNPEPHIKQWFEEKIWRLNGTKPRKYPSKQRSISSPISQWFASATLSDLESSDDEFLEF